MRKVEMNQPQTETQKRADELNQKISKMFSAFSEECERLAKEQGLSICMACLGVTNGENSENEGAGFAHIIAKNPKKGSLMAMSEMYDTAKMEFHKAAVGAMLGIDLG